MTNTTWYHDIWDAFVYVGVIRVTPTLIAIVAGVYLADWLCR